MYTKVYAMFDKKAQAFLQPFFAATDGLAIRSLMVAVREKGSNFNKFPGDFECFWLGTFDDQTGRIESDPKVHPQGVMTGLNALDASEALWDESEMMTRPGPGSRED